LRPRVFAWFRVLMVWSLVKPPAAAGPLSRIGDYLFAARGPGLVLWAIYFPAAPRPLWLRRHTTLLHHRTLLKVPTRCFIGGWGASWGCGWDAPCLAHPRALAPPYWIT